jgi:hypothetical protein
MPNKLGMHFFYTHNKATAVFQPWLYYFIVFKVSCLVLITI